MFDRCVLLSAWAKMRLMRLSVRREIRPWLWKGARTLVRMQGTMGRCRRGGPDHRTTWRWAGLRTGEGPNRDRIRVLRRLRRLPPSHHHQHTPSLGPEAMHGITMGTADDLPDSYLVLKSVHDARLAYTFPTVARSLNPCWRVDANERVDGYWHGLSASSVFQVDLYMRSSAEQAKHAPFLLQVSFCVDTSKLVFVGVDLHDIDRPFPANTILFQCADGFFKLDPTKEISRDDSFVLKESYDLDLCDRFLKFHEELGSLRRELKLLSKKLQVTTPRPETSSTSRQILFLRHETKSAVRSMNMGSSGNTASRITEAQKPLILFNV
ncbi:hypothetical protein BC830DRAFT_835556 [Chytriomyces sp. MP71]|nr:hypothetical protein BC830DRAFT_835556 [Chytriomyces sp. MP71]